MRGTPWREPYSPQAMRPMERPPSRSSLVSWSESNDSATAHRAPSFQAVRAQGATGAHPPDQRAPVLLRPLPGLEIGSVHDAQATAPGASAQWVVAPAWKPRAGRTRPGSAGSLSQNLPPGQTMESLIRDARLALKLLWKEKTFSATVLLTLAVCIGANVAIFSVIHTVLLEPLPFKDPDRLVTVFNSYPNAGAARASNGTVDFFQRREHVAAFEEVALYQGSGSTVGGDDGQRARVLACA